MISEENYFDALAIVIRETFIRNQDVTQCLVVMVKKMSTNILHLKFSRQASHYWTLKFSRRALLKSAALGDAS